MNALDGDPARSGGRRPWVRVLVIVLLLVQVASTLVLTFGAAGELLAKEAWYAEALIFLAAFFLGVSVMLIAAARALWIGRTWPRSVVLTWQLIVVVVALQGIDAAGWEQWGTLLLAVAIGTLLFVPGVAVPRTPWRGGDED